MFDPERKITHQEAMIMIQRAATLADFIGNTKDIKTFLDDKDVSNGALAAVKFNIASGIVAGSNDMLKPQDSITRAETATIVLRFLQKASLCLFFDHKHSLKFVESNTTILPFTLNGHRVELY